MKGSAIFTILLLGVAYTYWKYLVYAIIALAIVAIIAIATKFVRWAYALGRDMSLRGVDSMSGVEFEHHVAQLLARQGYTNVSLTEQYDYGVDIVADRDGIRWGIQVKRYSGLVKAEAVRQVVTGLRLYGCDRAMVITNSTFSNVARRLAEGNDCVLIDRSNFNKLERKYV